MENCPFVDDFPIKTCIYNGFSIAMLNNQIVCKKNTEHCICVFLLDLRRFDFFLLSSWQWKAIRLWFVDDFPIEMPAYKVGVPKDS